jgi:sigma-B regulation protein RsbU (phosphoserine phosphatase)
VRGLGVPFWYARSSVGLQCKFLKTVLEKQGHTVNACEDGVEAWDTYKRGHYRIIISDWMMPGMSGLDLCRAVRKLHKLPRCYFVMATARSAEVDACEALAAGADGYIVKPIRSEELEGRLRMAEFQFSKGPIPSQAGDQIGESVRAQA